MQQLDEMERAARAAGEAKVQHDKLAKKDKEGNRHTGNANGGGNSSEHRPAGGVLKRPAGNGVGCASFRVEWSRNQIVLDSGIAGPGRYRTLSFKKHGGSEGAKRAAEAWVAEQSNNP